MFHKQRSCLTAQVTARTLYCFLPLFAILLICLVGIYDFNREKYFNQLCEQGRRDLLKHKTECSYKIDWAVEDTLWLADLVRKHSLGKELTSQEKAQVADYFLSYGNLHRYYNQISYIDSTGDELIRVDFDRENAFIIPEHQLRSNQDRYGSKEAVQFENGKVYISRMELHTENGKIERPYKPVIRFATPLYDRTEQMKGVVVLHFNAQLILNTFQHEMLFEGEVSHNFLIDKEDYILAGPVPEYCWGFMFENSREKVFDRLFPEAGKLIRSGWSGVQQTPEGLFVWESVNPFQNLSLHRADLSSTNVKQPYQWKLIYYVPAEDINVYAHTSLLFLSGFGTVLGILLFAGCVRFAQLTCRQKRILETLKESEAKSREMAVRARMADQAKNQFLATMSHELRTPLNAILGFSDLLEEELNDEQKDYLNSIQSAGKKLFKIIEGILDFTKIERSRLKLDFDDCITEDILKKLQFSFKDHIKAKSLEFSISKTDQIPRYLFTDEVRLYECLENLLDNAVKFTESGHIYLNVGLDQDGEKTYVRFDIEDTGIGISQEHQDRIMQSFTQVDGGDTRKYGGVGMGLTLTKELVQQLYGKFSFVSRPGKGSVFTIMIPLYLESNFDQTIAAFASNSQ